jgi:hypothetical protein
VAHLALLDTGLRILMRFKIDFVFLQLLQHGLPPMFGQIDFGLEYGGLYEVERLAISYHFVFHVLVSIR